MTAKQLTTAIISSIQKASEKEDSGGDETPNKSNTQAGNAFGGRESAKRSKTSE
jgi:hypothetical protein